MAETSGIRFVEVYRGIEIGSQYRAFTLTAQDYERWREENRNPTGYFVGTDGCTYPVTNDGQAFRVVFQH